MKKLIPLESLRGFASLYVAAGHYILSLQNIPSPFSTLFRFGQEAVIVFFILSGFVIYNASIRNQNETLRSYFIKRFRRIYFPLICAIIVSIVFISHNFPKKELIGNLLMLQDFGAGKPGNLVTTFLGNGPLWSLSYEWTFYMLFPFVFPVIGKMKERVHLIGIFCILNLLTYIIFPNHLFIVFSYFLIWWTGLELAEYFIGVADKSKIKALLLYYIIAIVMLACVCAVDFKNAHTIKVGVYPYLILRHFVFGLICLCMSVYLTPLTKKLTSLLKPFALIAPISYGIYILHYPILVQSHFKMMPAIEIVVKIALVFGLAYLIEVILQPKINKLIR